MFQMALRGVLKGKTSLSGAVTIAACCQSHADQTVSFQCDTHLEEVGNVFLLLLTRHQLLQGMQFAGCQAAPIHLPQLCLQPSKPISVCS